VLNALVWIAGAEVPKGGVKSKTPTLEELEKHLGRSDRQFQGRRDKEEDRGDEPVASNPNHDSEKPSGPCCRSSEPWWFRHSQTWP
jgi:hypothetical protein